MASVDTKTAQNNDKVPVGISSLAFRIIAKRDTLAYITADTQRYV